MMCLKRRTKKQRAEGLKCELCNNNKIPESDYFCRVHYCNECESLPEKVYCEKHVCKNKLCNGRIYRSNETCAYHKCANCRDDLFDTNHLCDYCDKKCLPYVLSS